MGDARGRRGERVHRLALVDEPLEVETRSKLAARQRAAAVDRAVFGARGVQVEEIAHGRQQPRIVPGLGDVVGGARLDELDGGLEVGPGGQEDDRQVRVLLADPAEERDALLAGRRLAAEVHVLDHEVDRLASQRVEPGGRRVRGHDTRAMHGQQDVEGRAHGLAVVDHEYGALSQAALKSLVLRVLHGLGCALCQ